MTDTFDSQSFGRRVNEMLILSELRRAPRHGYQVALELDERSAGYFPFSHGTLYPILHRLEQEGLIAGEWSDPARGRAKKRYAVTEAGRTYLKELIADWKSLEVRLRSVVELREEGGDEQVRTGAA